MPINDLAPPGRHYILAYRRVEGRDLRGEYVHFLRALRDAPIASRVELEALRADMDARMKKESKNQFTRALLGELPSIVRLEYVDDMGTVILGVTEGDDLTEPDPPVEAPIVLGGDAPVEVVALQEAA